MTAIKLAVTAVLVSLLGWAAACGDDEGPNGSPSPTPVPQAELPLPDPWEVHIAAADGSGETLVYTDDRASGFAWSPDGSQLAIAAGDYESTTVRFVSLDGEERASVTVDGSAGWLTWSPDGQYVAAVFTVAANNSLVALASDGSSQRELLNEPIPAFIQPAGWLPGGELLVEKGQSTGGGRLLAIDVESGASRELAELDIYPDYFGRPAVSPDGRLLAVTVRLSGGRPCGSPDNGNAIWTIDLETGATTQVSPGDYCGGGSMAMAWSPDGTQIAFSALVPVGSSGLYITDVATHEARQLTTGLDQVAAWLEDGTILARRLICTGCDAGPGKVVAIDSESGELQELTEDGAPADISPSGQIVAAREAIEILDATGAQIRVLAPVEALWRYTAFQWSPDEAHVAYLRFHAPGQHVYELNADGSGFKIIGAYEVATAALSPDGFRVAYLDPPGTKDSGGRLFLAKRDGADPVAVEVPNVHSFSWSPPGGPLLFTALEAPGAEASIYVVNGDGSGLRKIETSSTISIGSRPAVWAPNGMLVAFAEQDIQVLNVDTGEVATVAEDVMKALPAWSWDSTKLVYGRGFFGRNGSEIAILNTDGSGSTTILSDDRYLKNGVVFSPDGARIAFFTPGAQKDTRLVVANVDGSDEQVIAEGALLASTAVAWSPDGQWIAVAMGLEGRLGLFLIKPDGSERRQLTHGAPMDDIEWLDETSLRFTTYQAGL